MAKQKRDPKKHGESYGRPLKTGSKAQVKVPVRKPNAKTKVGRAIQKVASEVVGLAVTGKRGGLAGIDKRHNADVKKNQAKKYGKPGGKKATNTKKTQARSRNKKRDT